MHTRTKIICTIGPAVNTLEKIKELIQAGMNVARLNFSHGTHEEHLAVINTVKQAREELQTAVAIMLDTKGPEIRLGKLEQKEIYLSAGQQWKLIGEEREGNAEFVQVKPFSAIANLDVGATVLFDDGYISSKVIEVKDNEIFVQIENGGTIKSGKGINIPDVNVALPALTEKDIEDIKFGCEHDIDLIAASFIRSPEHVIAIKELLVDLGASDVQVISKIENAEGVRNFDHIVQVTDGIMIARGDLGVELPLSQVPRLQKMMVHKSCHVGKPTVTATQMLESMIYNPRPTRAETSDVANAIYDSTTAVMLSGETAVGHHPIETVKVMKSIIEETEKDFDYRAYFTRYSSVVYHDVPSSVTLATVRTAYSTNARVIFAFTSSGMTVQSLSRFRPDMTIIAMTSNPKCYHQMAYMWGVIPFLSEKVDSYDEALTMISSFALENRLVDYGDLVVVTAGNPFGISGTTNMMIVESIGDVLVRGHIGYGERIHGNVMILLSPENKEPYEARGKILVINRCDTSYENLIAESIGVILENPQEDKDSEIAFKALLDAHQKPGITRADRATKILKEGGLVTIDPEKANVYKGVVL